MSPMCLPGLSLGVGTIWGTYWSWGAARLALVRSPPRLADGVARGWLEGDVGEEHWPWDSDPVIGTGYWFVGVDDVLGSLDGSQTF
jgi:hypothetical protein